MISGTRLSLFLNVQSAISHIVTCFVAYVCCSVIRKEKRKPGNEASNSLCLSMNTCVQFPHCGEYQAVSLSCLDIHYFVTTKAKTPVLDDQLSMGDTEPIVLGSVIEDVEDLDDLLGNCCIHTLNSYNVQFSMGITDLDFVRLYLEHE